MTHGQKVAAAKVFRRGPFRIPAEGVCSVCGTKFRQPGNGRPRVICSRKQCALERRNALRRREDAGLWAVQDFEEARRIFRERCAFCEKRRELAPSRFHLPPVPACSDCVRDAGAQLRVVGLVRERLAYYLGRASHGLPLPDPFRIFPDRKGPSAHA